MPTQCYDAPSWKFRRRFFATLSVDLDGVWARKWNFDRVIIFSRSYCNASKALITPDIFASVYCFDLTAGIVRCLTNLWKTRGGRICLCTGNGGVQPVILAEDWTVFINKTAALLFSGKYPHENNSSCATLETYDRTPIFITVYITEDAVKSVARKLWGGSGPGGTNLEALQEWVLKFGEDRKILSTIVETLSSGYSIRAHPGRPIIHLFLAAWLCLTNSLMFARSESRKLGDVFLLRFC